MNKAIITTILMLCITTLCCVESKAQKFYKLREEYRKTPPKAVLVKLHTWQNKLNHYKSTNQTEKYELTQNDIKQIMTRTVADFNDNFDYCTFYFFIDTNSKAVMNQDFAGILLDKDLQPVNDPIVHKGDTNYFIVQYGALGVDETSIASWDTHGQQLASSTAANTGDKQFLVVYNYQFKQLPKYTNIRKADVAGGAYKQGKAAYKYESPISRIGYKGRAGALNNMFYDFFGKNKN